MSAIGFEEVSNLENVREIETFYPVENGEKLEIKILFDDGALRISIPDNYPDIIPEMKPDFPELDNKVISTLLDCSAELLIGQKMLENLLTELEDSILPDLRENREINRKNRKEPEEKIEKSTGSKPEEPTNTKQKEKKTRKKSPEKSKAKMKVGCHREARIL